MEEAEVAIKVGSHRKLMSPAFRASQVGLIVKSMLREAAGQAGRFFLALIVYSFYLIPVSTVCIFSTVTILWEWGFQIYIYKNNSFQNTTGGLQKENISRIWRLWLRTFQLERVQSAAAGLQQPAASYYHAEVGAYCMTQEYMHLWTRRLILAAPCNVLKVRYQMYTFFEITFE